MAHSHSPSPEVVQLIEDASRLTLDPTSFKKMEFDNAPGADAYDIPWNSDWDALVNKAVEESKPHWKNGATQPWPYARRAVELRSGGLKTKLGYRSLVIPLIMTKQSDKVAIFKKQDGNGVKTSPGTPEEWKIALYVFEDYENIHTLHHPIRFIWIRFTKPWMEVFLE